jgi:hypothetical protein
MKDAMAAGVSVNEFMIPGPIFRVVVACATAARTG